MKKGLKIIFFSVCLFCLCLAGYINPAPAGAGCLSAACHTAMLNGEDVHAVDNECGKCHESVETGHPVAGKKTFGLIAGDICASCHSEIMDHKSVHPPVAAGDCLACHQLHGNKTKKLLTQAKEADLCFNCHDGVFNRDLPVLHGSIREGVCTSCHDPHGTDYEQLLIEEFPVKLFVGYNDEEYRLCFFCHQRALLLFPETSFATGFRDGDRNLHYVHVHKINRGKNCKLCHAIHAGRLPKLMAETVPFGKWRLPLNFQATETGGSCMPGCHRKRSYDRNTQVNKP